MRAHPSLLLLAAGAALALAAACSAPSNPPPAAPKAAAPAATPAAPATPAATPAESMPPATDAAAPATDAAMAPIGEEAKTVFTTRCSVCHGTSGHGDGPGAVALNPKPRNYSDAAWQASVTDDHLAKVIVQGGTSVGLSPLMAPNADLAGKPEVVKDLVRMIRDFKGK